jgi:hypothetical protein
VVKTSKILKDVPFTGEFANLIQGLLARIPSVDLQAIEKESARGKLRGPDFDFRATLKVGGKPWTIIGAIKRLGQPNEIRGAVAQLQLLSGQLPRKSNYGIILAPYISPESAQLCDEAGVGYADLSGNAKLAFGPIYIETQGKENAFKRQKEAKSLFSPKSQRVLRTLLQGPLKTWKVSELAEASEVSLGWASALKQQLVAREWASEERGGLRITRPDSVLDAWAASDDWGSRTEVRQYSSLSTEPLGTAKDLQRALGKKRIAFTQWIAGWLRQPYTLPLIVTAYVEEWPEDAFLESRLNARRVPRGGRLWLVKPKDAGVFRPGQEIQGFPLVSDIQIYLDLLKAGQRGDEEAAELRKRKGFSGGWN